MSANELIADLLMLAHAGYSLFVIVGLMLIVVGIVLGWRWTRNRYFRIAHLGATLVAVVRVWSASACPFSVAEDHFRGGVTAPCPLGTGFHEVVRGCALRGANPRYFAGSATLFGAITLVVFVANRNERGKRSLAT